MLEQTSGRLLRCVYKLECTDSDAPLFQNKSVVLGFELVLDTDLGVVASILSRC